MDIILDIDADDGRLRATDYPHGVPALHTEPFVQLEFRAKGAEFAGSVDIPHWAYFAILEASIQLGEESAPMRGE